MENVSKRRNKSNNYCCVPQCISYYSENLSFHKFPKEKVLLNEWRRVLKIAKPISNHMQVCSKHFRKEDYFFNRALTSKKHCLKTGTIPSCNLPKTSFSKKENEHLAENRAKRIRNRERLRDSNRKIEDKTDENVNVNVTEDPTLLEAANILVNFSESGRNAFNDVTYQDNSSKTEQKSFEDKGIQVNTPHDFINEDIMSEIVTTDYKLRILTGIYSIALLNVLIKGVSKFDTSRNISFVALSVFFNVSASTAQATFQTTVKTLALLLKHTIRFPSTAEIQKNIPQCFQKYSATRIVLDCTEIAVQKSKCLNCSIRTYSNYKGRQTIKFLIGASPSGLITYISKPYGGRASDKAIFNKEKLISKLDSGDAIMVDKGFLIEKECENNDIKLIRPPFLRKKTQFTEGEALETADIARARVHVERVIQRIKLFRICKNVLPFTMLPFINNAMTIIVAVTNLSKPILARDKF